MKAREGDLLETRSKLIFDVKGLVHPSSRIVAFPRFVPDPKGTRARGHIIYKKVYSLSERYTLIEAQFPKYLVADPVFGERLCEVPKEDIVCHYDPIDHLRELRESRQLDLLESDALSFMELLHNSGIPWREMGISGSLLAKLHAPDSDIDPVIYGEESCRRVYQTLESLMKNEKEGVRTYTKEELKTLYIFRSQDTKMPFNSFIKTESRKVLQGKFLSHDFYVRCIKDWNETEEKYGDTVYTKVGHGKIGAEVVNASEAIFTPCRYSVDNVQVLGGNHGGDYVAEIASFRGRFCEQARFGERVVAQGKLEKVQKKSGETFFRLLLGGSPSDFMVLER